jgi:uncharacterized protein (UPF0335 family)
MTPQQLIDLPGYGSAKRELIKQGQWRICVDDTERIEWIGRNVGAIQIDGNGKWIFDLAQFSGYDVNLLRKDINEQASRAAAVIERARKPKGTPNAPER